MADKCVYCGSDIPEDQTICSVCGGRKAVETEVTEPVAEPAEDIAAEETGAGVTLEETLDAMFVETPAEVPAEAKAPTKRKKVKWWYIAIPVVAVIALAVALLWNTLTVYLFPEIALANAIGNTVAALETRSQGTPFTMMNKAIDEEGKSTSELDVECTIPDMGDFSIDMQMQSDAQNKQYMTDISVGAQGVSMDMGLYMDADKLGFNMEMLTGESYYGIVYDGFGENLRNNEFLASNLGEEGVEIAEEIVSALENVLNQEQLTEEQLRASRELYLQVVLDFLKEQELEPGRAAIELDGSQKKCYSITVQLTKEDLVALVDNLLEAMKDDPVVNRSMDMFAATGEDTLEELIDSLQKELEESTDEGEGAFEFVFYLYDNQLAQVDIEVVTEGEEGESYSGSYSLIFGTDAAKSDITLRMTSKWDDDTEDVSELRLTTTRDGDIIREEILIVSEGDDEEESRVVLGYEWDRKQGDFEIFAEEIQDEENDINISVKGSLLEEENSYSLTISNLMEQLQSVIGNDLGDMEGFELTLSISAQAGADIEEPEITDITSMSETDFYQILMSGSGM